MESDMRKLYIKVIQVECHSSTGDTSGFAGLKLSILDGLDYHIDLTNTSAIIWKQRKRIPRPVETSRFYIIASSPCLGDIGHVYVDFSAWAAQIDPTSSPRKRKRMNLKKAFEPSEDGLALSISFEMFNSTFHQMGRKQLSTPLRDIDPIDIYEALQLVDDDSPTKPDSLNFSCAQLMLKFLITRSEDDIGTAIEAYDQAIALLPANDPRTVNFIENQGRAWRLRFSTFGQITDIDRAIESYQQALAMTPSDHTKMPDRLDTLGRLFQDRFHQNNKLEDISNAIRFHQRAVQFVEQGFPIRLQGFGIALLDRFRYTGNLEDLSESIHLLQRAVEMTPEEDEDLPVLLSNLGNALYFRFERSQDLADISNSIQFHRRATQLTPPGHENLPTWFSNLGSALCHRFERTGDQRDIRESIQVQDHAIKLAPPGHKNLSSFLNNLGNALLRLSEQGGGVTSISAPINVLNLAIHFLRLATRLTPEGHGDRPQRLTNLAVMLSMRFEQRGDLEDILESIQLLQLSIQLTVDGHVDLPLRLFNLGNSLIRCFERTGNPENIVDSIRHLQRAVQMTPDGHASLPSRLNSLGTALIARFEQTEDLADLAESARLRQRAVELTPEEHADLPFWMNNLGGSYLACFKQTGKLEYLSKSIRVRQRAVQLTPEGHSSLPMWLNNLGNALTSRFERTSQIADISESIKVHRQAIQLTSGGHAILPTLISNLANAISCRFLQTRNLADSEECIQLHEEALLLTPDGSADIPVRFYNLGLSFHRHFERTEEPDALTSAIFNYRASAMANTGFPSHRLKAAEQLAELCKVTRPIFASQLLEAHEHIIHLHTLITGFSANSLKHRQRVLTQSSKLSTTAAATALSMCNPGKALEWLEQGRCIIWNQIYELRTPVDELHAHDPVLANRLRRLSKQLEIAGTREDPRYYGLELVELPIPAQISLENDIRDQLKVIKERDELLATIRNIPGFKNFLKARSYTSLMKDLPKEGPVIIINADKDRCDALALVAGCDDPMHIPLESLSYEKAKRLSQKLQTYLTSRQLRSRYSENATDLRAAGALRPPGSPRGQLKKVLHALWNDLVEPILEALAIKIPEDNQELPRIWWCPTGPFALLPIHAAGIYEGASAARRCLADFAISSYIPSLGTLQRLRSRGASDTDNGILLISQPDTPGLFKIPGTCEEVRNIGDMLNKEGFSTTLYESDEATSAVVSKALSTCSCVHFACHAFQDGTNPLESAIHLYDGALTLSAIMQENLLHADLAYLSACQTSVGDEKLSEEAVHLAAGMLAAGYRSVVATMWSISDTYAPRVAERFYENILRDSCSKTGPRLNITNSARALHTATRRLRDEVGDSNMGLLEWIPYVHFGL